MTTEEAAPAPRRAVHPELSPPQRRTLLHDGVGRFQAGDFFVAHELWEEVWRSTTPEPRELLQGLIQIAAALYAWRDLGRVDGPRRTLERGLARVERFGDVALGLDLARVLTGARAWRDWLAAGGVGEPPPLPCLVVREPDALR